MPKEFQQHNQPPNTEEKKGGISRRGLLKKGSLAAGMISFASALGLTPFSPAQAAVDQQSQSNIKIKNLARKEATVYFQATLNSLHYQQFRREIGQQYAGIFTIDEQQFTAMTVSTAQQTTIIVHIPIRGGAEYSFFSAFFHQSSPVIVSAMWGLFTFTSNNDIHALVTRDETTLFEGNLTPDGVIKQGTTTYPDGTRTVTGASTSEAIIQANFWSCLGECLAAQGVPAWIVAILSIICGIACTVLPPTCINCLILQLGVVGSVVSYCVGKCWGK